MRVVMGTRVLAAVTLVTVFAAGATLGEPKHASPMLGAPHAFLKHTDATGCQTPHQPAAKKPRISPSVLKF